MKEAINYFNANLGLLGYFNRTLCLVDKIEKENRAYPAIYNNNNEYVEINLDEFGSVSYWRKNGDVTISRQDNNSVVGVQYLTNMPLKLVGFITKHESVNDAYFADNVCLAIISRLTTDTAVLKPFFKAKIASLVASRYTTDRREVAQSEYDNINFEARYNSIHFSIDFELSLVTNKQCFVDICNNNPIDPLTLYNFCDNSIFNRLTEAQRLCLSNQLCTMFDELTLDSGSIDGINTIFTWSDAPVQLFLNGQLLAEGTGYTLAGNTTTLSSAPFTGDILSAYANQ